MDQYTITPQFDTEKLLKFTFKIFRLASNIDVWGTLCWIWSHNLCL